MMAIPDVRICSYFGDKNEKTMTNLPLAGKTMRLIEKKSERG